MQINPKKRPWTPETNQGTRYKKASSWFYHSSEWKRIRAAKLAKNPYCECDQCAGKMNPAHMVDHIKRIEEGGSMTDFGNLQSMSNSCHARKSARESNESRK